MNAALSFNLAKSKITVSKYIYSKPEANASEYRKEAIVQQTDKKSITKQKTKMVQ